MARQFSAAFKFEVVRQLQLPQAGERRLAQVGHEHDLDPGMVRDWRTRVETHGADAFPHSPREEPTPAPQTSLTLPAVEARVGELERLVGQLTLENGFLRKAWRRASSGTGKGAS